LFVGVGSRVFVGAVACVCSSASSLVDVRRRRCLRVFVGVVARGRLSTSASFGVETKNGGR